MEQGGDRSIPGHSCSRDGKDANHSVCLVENWVKRRDHLQSQVCEFSSFLHIAFIFPKHLTVKLASNKYS